MAHLAQPMRPARPVLLGPSTLLGCLPWLRRATQAVSAQVVRRASSTLRALPASPGQRGLPGRPALKQLARRAGQTLLVLPVLPPPLIQPTGLVRSPPSTKSALSGLSMSLAVPTVGVPYEW
jgi:hypothetical protein